MGRGNLVVRIVCRAVPILEVVCFVNVSAGAALGDHRTIAKPPLRVGEIYPTDPPPLASLEGVLGTKPVPADLDLYVRSFARVAFEPEDYDRYPWIVRFKQRVFIGLKEKVETRHHQLLQRVVEDRSLITGLKFHVIQPSHDFSDTSLDIIVYVSDHYVAGDERTRTYCAMWSLRLDVDGVLLHQQIVLSTAMQGDALTECFYEDISQALGIYGDNALSEERMYRDQVENGQWPSPTWHDVIMLRTLYGRRIRPGMHEDQAMPLVRVIIAELLEELNAVAE